MNSDLVLVELRRFLFIVSAGVFIMTVTELVFLNHWNETIQLLPFALSGLGLACLAIAYFRPTRRSLTSMRWSMIVIGVFSLVGFYEHTANNLAFRVEVQPNATTWELIKATLGGADPVLAPGILMLGAVIGLLAIYKDPGSS